MADVSKIKLPDNSVVNIKDARITGVDTTPTSGSTNVVTSGGTRAAIQSAIDDVSNTYLPLAGGTMSGAIKFPAGNREILHFAGTDASWGSGLKYSWSNRTAIAFWGKHAETAFVWNAGTDYSATDVPSTGTSYDFKIQRVSGVPNVTTTGKYIGTAFVKKDGTSSQFLKADGSVDSNTYATTAQLTNGSVTKLGTATKGSATMPIYLNAGTPTAISSFPEAYLSWGGKNFSASYGPIDAAMVDPLGACRTMFAHAGGIVIEYSTDAGQTWLDYGATDAQKVDLFSGGATAFRAGKSTTAATASVNNMLRVTLNTSAAAIYTVLNKFVIYFSTNGSSGCYCTIRTRLQSDYEASADTWVVKADSIPMAGWSGYNVINVNGITTYGNNKSAQYGQIQFIFGCTGVSSSYPGFYIFNIYGYGGVGWTAPSNMARSGHLYSWDSTQNATFPANVKATSFIKTGGTSSQFLKADGSVDSKTYALASAIPTVDATPTASSTNAVSSGGVYAELANVVRQEDMERLTTSEIADLLNL